MGDVTRLPPAGGPPSVLDRPLSLSVNAALTCGRNLQRRYPPPSHLVHEPGLVHVAHRIRREHLAEFADVDATAMTLMAAYDEPLDRTDCTDMLTAMFYRLGAKTNEETEGLIVGALDALNDDDSAHGLWTPIVASPLTIALGCKKLIATSKWPPKPVEVREAVIAARLVVASARDAALVALEEIVAADAIILQYANPYKWRAPWETPEFRPQFARMFELHRMSEVFSMDFSPFRVALDHAKRLLDEVPTEPSE